ncbi:MAG TPA: UvrD-helicase domain-containing protein [Nitrososphaerales archaeon]|nr:UvrD-helicase domain-containing protein [Nitrososphaerales archaeon]
MTVEAVQELRKVQPGLRELVASTFQDVASGSWEDWRDTTPGFSRWVGKGVPERLFSLEIPDFGTMVWSQAWSVDLPSVLEAPLDGRRDGRAEMSYAAHVIFRRVLPKGRRAVSPFEFEGRLYEPSANDESETFWEREPKDEVEYSEELFHLSPAMIGDFLSGAQVGLPLHLSREQVEVLRPKGSPWLLSGRAGSGKSSVVTAWLLINHVRHLEGEPPHTTPVSQLFVTFSERLRLRASIDFETTLPHIYAFHRTQFRTYRDLLYHILTLAGHRPDYPPEREMSFERFMKEYAPRLPKSVDPVLQWDEIRSVIKGGTPAVEGLLNLEQYKALSDQRGYCKVPSSLRELYHKGAIEYDDYLRDNQMWDSVDLARASLDNLQVSEKYDKIACDEVQDLTTIEIVLLLRLLERDGRLADLFFTGDTAQVINPSGFLWERLKKEIFEESKQASRPEVEYLKKNYRSCEEIVNLVNEVLVVRRDLLNDEISKEEQEPLLRANVKPLFVNGSPLDVLKSSPSNPYRRLVIAKTPEEKTKLETLLGDSRDRITLLTIEEAKGLEYDGALLWKFFIPRHEMITKDDWSSVFTAERRKHLKETIASGQKSSYGLTYEFNLLHVGLTRARQLLAFYDESSVMRIENLGGGVRESLSEIAVEDFEKLWKTGTGTGQDFFDLGEKLWGRDTLQAKRMFVRAAEEFARQGDFDMEAKSYEKAEEFLRAAECYIANKDRLNQLRMLVLHHENRKEWAEAGRFGDERGKLLFESGQRQEAASAYSMASVDHSLAGNEASAAKSLLESAESLPIEMRAEKAKTFADAAKRWDNAGNRKDAIQARYRGIEEANRFGGEQGFIVAGRPKSEWIASQYMEISNEEDNDADRATAADRSKGIWRTLLGGEYSRYKEEYERNYRQAFARQIESLIRAGDSEKAFTEQAILLAAFRSEPVEIVQDEWKTLWELYLQRRDMTKVTDTVLQLIDNLSIRNREDKAIEVISEALTLPFQIPQMLKILQRRLEVAMKMKDNQEIGRSHELLAEKYRGIEDSENLFRSLYAAAGAFLKGGFLEKAADHYQDAFEVLEQLRISDMGEYCYDVADSYIDQQLHKEAFYWADKASRYFAEEQDYEKWASWLKERWRGRETAFNDSRERRKAGMTDATEGKLNLLRQSLGLSEFVFWRYTRRYSKISGTRSLNETAKDGRTKPRSRSKKPETTMRPKKFLEI